MDEHRGRRCAELMFQLSTIRHVHVTRRYAVIEESDVQVVCRDASGRWTCLRPLGARRGRIVLDRETGRVVKVPRGGKSGGPAYTSAAGEANSASGVNRMAANGW